MTRLNFINDETGEDMLSVDTPSGAPRIGDEIVLRDARAWGRNEGPDFSFRGNVASVTHYFSSGNDFKAVVTVRCLDEKAIRERKKFE